MRGIISTVLAATLLMGCSGTGSTVSTGSMLPAGTCTQLAAFSPLFHPVGVGVSYVMPTGPFRDTVAYDLNYSYVMNESWELTAQAQYMRLTWDNGVTKSDVAPILIGARYRQDMESGASWYAGLGVGYSLNDGGDMDDSLAAKVTLGMEQPMGQQNMLVGLEAGYMYNEADATWGTFGKHDLSNLFVRLNFILLIGPQ